MFARLLKYSIDTNNGTAGTLGAMFKRTLGKVISERATPFPCQTFDTTTLYIVSSFPSWLKRHKGTTDEACTFDVRKRRALTCFTGEAIANLLFGLIVCRSMGRVNAHHQFTIHLNSSQGSCRKSPFMPEIVDLDVLLSFIHGTNIGRKSMSLASSWTSSQLVVPKAFCYLAPFREFLLSVCEHALPIANKLIELSSSSHLHP
jgi:hypothetical protein